VNEIDRRPAWVELAEAVVDGVPTRRLIFIFRAIGCAWARRPEGGCTMCGFQAMATGREVASEDLIAQFESLFDDPRTLEGVGQLDLYNSGSFFADQEIAPEVRRHVLSSLTGTDVRRVLVEARPEHVRREKLVEAREALDDTVLEIGIGLESADDHVRDVLVRKGYGKAEFETAVREIRSANDERSDLAPLRLLVYLLIKPPGLSERDAVKDAIASARYVAVVARREGVPARVAFQPVFVPPGTALEQEFLASRFKPPSLWSVLEVVRAVHGAIELSVGMSDEGLDPHLGPMGCTRCTASLKAALVDYNRTHELAALEGLCCDCRDA